MPRQPEQCILYLSFSYPGNKREYKKLCNFVSHKQIILPSVYKTCYKIQHDLVVVRETAVSMRHERKDSLKIF